MKPEQFKHPNVCREKELLKEKRRKRQQLFQEQKVSFADILL